MYYLANWGKIREKAWSGTYYGLFNALSQIPEINIKDIPLYKPIISNVLQKLKIKKRDYEISNIIYNRKKIGSSCDNDVVLQFSEIINNDNSYIYQDLSVSYIKFLYENNKELLCLMGNSDVSEKYLNKRLEMQSNYYSKCKGIFTMGQWLKEDLINRCGISPEKVYHVGGGTNINISLIKELPKTNNKILFVGRDFKRKGGYIVYDAFKILKQEKKDAELYVAGPISNPIENPIEGYIFLGDCSYRKVSQLYNMCDIFCMPSYFEAYGLVFVEALIFGLPCIGRNCYEMPYFIDDEQTGFLLKNDDPFELAQLMKRLLNDSTIKKNVLDRKRWYIQEYSWNTVAQRIKEVII